MSTQTLSINLGNAPLYKPCSCGDMETSSMVAASFTIGAREMLEDLFKSEPGGKFTATKTGNTVFISLDIDDMPVKEVFKDKTQRSPIVVLHRAAYDALIAAVEAAGKPQEAGKAPEAPAASEMASDIAEIATGIAQRSMEFSARCKAAEATSAALAEKTRSVLDVAEALDAKPVTTDPMVPLAVADAALGLDQAVQEAPNAVELPVPASEPETAPVGVPAAPEATPEQDGVMRTTAALERGPGLTRVYPSVSLPPVA
jgi:hypothetical protein